MNPLFRNPGSDHNFRAFHNSLSVVVMRLCFFTYIRASTQEYVSSGGLQTTSAQSDQRLRYLLIGKEHI